MGKEKCILDVCETSQQISVAIKKPSLRYLDGFVKLKCAPDLLAWGVFPNAKEITEAMAAWRAVRVNCRHWLKERTNCYVIGDGRTPRLGALVACLSGWNVTSIDPIMHERFLHQTQIKRLLCCKKLAEEVFTKGMIWEKLPRAVILAVHSHAKLQPIWEWCLRMYKEVLCVAIPCCVPQETGEDPAAEYADWGIHSPKRTVKIWRHQNLWKGY